MARKIANYAFLVLVCRSVCAVYWNRDFVTGSSNKKYFLSTLPNLYDLEVPSVTWNMSICDNQCLLKERQVLLDINRNLDGKDWIRKWDIVKNDTALSTAFHCDWNGILCDNKTKHIISIYLSHNNVHGKLPVNVSNLQFLLSFRIGSNSVQGQFEKIVAAMPKHLIRLEIANSNINGRIPGSIAKSVPRLSKLQMSGSRLSDEIPDSIGGLIHLTVLSLGETQINGSIPQSISRLTKLWFLDMEALRLKGNLSFLYNLRNLSYLHLSSNQISGQIPEYIGERCANLKDLRLSNNKLSGHLPRSLGMLTILEEMNIEKNNLSGVVPVDLFNLKLKVLVLSSNKFTGFETGSNDTFKGLTLFRASFLSTFNCSLDIILSYLKGSETTIMQIDISHSNIYGQISSLIYSFNNLAFLKLASNKLSGSIPAPWRNLPFFTLLDLQNNDLSGSIPLSFSRLIMLTELNVKGNKRLRGPAVSSLMLLDYKVAIKERISDTCPMVRFAHNNGTIYVDSSYYDRQYCHCNENYFGNGKHCIPCVPGGSCPGITTAASIANTIEQLTADQVQLPVTTMRLKQGYYPFPSESDVESIHKCPSSRFKICVPEGSCGCYVNTTEEIKNLSKPVANEVMHARIHCNKSCLCLAGHKGRHCSQCIEDYYKDGIHCVQCPVGTKEFGLLFGIPSIIIFFSAASYFFLQKKSKRTIHFRLSVVVSILLFVLAFILVLTHVLPVFILQLAIIIMFLQYINHFERCTALMKSAIFYLQVMDSLISTTDIWPKELQNEQVYASVSMNFRFSSLACVAPKLFAPLGKNITLFILPLIGIVLLWLVKFVAKRSVRLTEMGLTEFKCRKYSISVIDLAYFPIAKSCFSVIIGCTDIDGLSFMKRYVWIDCDSSEKSSLFLLAFFALAVYVIAVPIFVYIPLLYYHRNSLSDDSSDTGKWLSPLIAAYKIKYRSYMEVVMLFRRLSIAIFLEVFPAASSVQMQCITLVLILAIIFQATVRPFKIRKRTTCSDERYMGLENAIDISMLSCVLISAIYVGLFAGNETSVPSGISRTIISINAMFVIALFGSVLYRLFEPSLTGTSLVRRLFPARLS